MSAVDRALRRGISTAVRYAGREVTVYLMSWTADDPMAADPRYTVAQTIHLRGLFSPLRRALEPVGAGMSADAAVLLQLSELPRIPNKGDRFKVNGVMFNVVKSQKVKGAAVKLYGAGPAARH